MRALMPDARLMLYQGHLSSVIATPLRRDDYAPLDAMLLLI